MQILLSKRIIRDLKENFFRYLALFLLIVMGMYIVIAIVTSAEIIMIGAEERGIKSHLEDGQFGVFVPLNDNEIEDLQEEGIVIEEQFYLDYILQDSSMVRIYKNRNEIDLINLSDGKLAGQAGEIVLEQHYAKSHELHIGDSIEIGKVSFEITGICSTPDYEAVLKNMSDTSVDSSFFGNGFVCESQYNEMKKAGNFSKAEEYVYSYLLNNKMTDNELKDYLCGLELDRSKVTDVYFLKMLDEIEATKDEIVEGIGELADGTKELNYGLDELVENNDDINEAVNGIFLSYINNVNEKLKSSGFDVTLTEQNYEEKLDSMINTYGSTNAILGLTLKSAKEQLQELGKFKSGMKEYLSGTKEAAEGTVELNDGVFELQEHTNKLIDEFLTVDIDNLTTFIPKEDNMRIGASIDDVIINKYAGIANGVIIMMLFTYVISVFIVHGIEQESSIIGALYALGVKRKQLMVHYLLLPILVTFFGGVIGTALGFSSYGAGILLKDTIVYFSLPVLPNVYPMYLIVYGIIMPPVIAVVVNLLVISKKLKRPALQLLRNEQKTSKFTNVNLGKLGFIRRFQIRQMLREARTSFTVVIGMFIALLILMLGVNCYMLCENMSVQNKTDTKYDYMYTYKYPTHEAPKGGEACYAEALKKEAYGYNLDITVLGIDEDNPYFNFEVSENKNEITISQSVATKFNIDAGDKLVLTDEVNNMDYAFTVKRIVPYSVGLYVFLDIDGMRELFNQEDDYYNMVFSDKKLDIEAGRLYATTTKENVAQSADVFIKMMMPMVISMIVAALIIFVVVMYLMLKVMIDRSAFHISLMKVFGFRKREIKKLYLDGNFIIVAVGAAICIPLSKFCTDVIYPYLISNVASGTDMTFTWQLYLLIYTGIILCYLIINQMLLGRLKKMIPAEVLKSRE